MQHLSPKKKRAKMLAKRLMPEKINLGRGGPTCMGMPMGQLKEYLAGEVHFGQADRVVMGYQLPSWQRPLVWTMEQNVSFMESLWRGVPCGTWTFNRFYGKPELDDLLIDGQQRLNAIEEYLSDGFPVFGYRWSEITRVDRRVFDTIVFPSYITETDDESYLRQYYNMMNFGGTAHKEGERA